MDSTPRNDLRASTVCSTYELLEHILLSAELHNQDLLNCAVVCRSWSDVALNRLWSSVSFHNLLVIFPLKKKRIRIWTEWSITGTLRASDWARFLYYSTRIRTLEANLSITSFDYHSVSFLSEMAFSRPVVALFPKLQRLSWTHHGNPYMEVGWVKFSRFFLHERLAEIHISIKSDTLFPHGIKKTEDISVFLQEIPVRSPNVSFLSIQTKTSLSDGQIAELGLQNVISLLPHLAHLLLSSPFIESRLMVYIASMPHLFGLTLRPASNRSNMDLLKDNEDPFPRLSTFEVFRVFADNLGQFIRIVSRGGALTTLNVSIVDYTEEALETLTQDVAFGCPDLEHFVVSKDVLDRPVLDEVSELGRARLPTITKDTLEQLQSFRQLKHLRITYYRPSEMIDDDFITFTEALPNLTEMGLRCVPVTTERPGLTLRVLHRLSEFYRCRSNFSGISKLQLQVDAQAWPDHVVGAFLLSSDFVDIKSLRTMTISSSSPIAYADNVALYLSQFIPPTADFDIDNVDNCSLPLGSDDEYNANHSADVAEMSNREGICFQVSTQLRILQRLQYIVSARKTSKGCGTSCY